MPDRLWALARRHQRMGVDKLRGSKQYSETFARGRRFAVGHVVVIVRPAPGAVRWGIVAGKRVGPSVVRNRVKRRLREISRAVSAELRGGADVVLVAQPGAAKASYDALFGAVVAALRRAKLLTSEESVARRLGSGPRGAGQEAGPR